MFQIAKSIFNYISIAVSVKGVENQIQHDIIRDMKYHMQNLSHSHPVNFPVNNHLLKYSNKGSTLNCFKPIFYLWKLPFHDFLNTKYECLLLYTSSVLKWVFRASCSATLASLCAWANVFTILNKKWKSGFYRML